jgi:LysM repeat protein
MFRHVFVFCCLTGITLALVSLAGAYTVQSGDTPAGIAKKHGITVEELFKANKGIQPTKMRVGDTLNIPGASGGKSDKKSDQETRSDKASHKAEPTKEKTAEPKERDKDHKAPATAKSASHTVKKGETLGEIASKLGVSTEDLVKANKGLDPRRMRIGQELVVPGAAKAEKTVEPAEKSSRKSEKSAEPSEKSSRKAEKTPAQEPTKTYTAHKRDTPQSVARKFHIGLKELARLNPDMGKKLHSGQKLIVPAESRSSQGAAEEPMPEAEPEAAPAQAAKPAQTAGPEVAEVAPAKPAKTPGLDTATPTLPDSKESADAESYFEKGIEFGKQNKFPKAVENFDKAIKLNPNRADYFASRGHANYYLKQYAKAIDDYTKAIEKNPNFALAYSMRGLSRTRSGRYPQAIEDFNRAIALGPNEADFYKGRGFTYLHLKQPAPMCQDYKKACDLGDCELLESARKEKACP